MASKIYPPRGYKGKLFFAGSKEKTAGFHKIKGKCRILFPVLLNCLKACSLLISLKLMETEL